MLFNSLAFAVFFPIVFAIYWAINRYASKARNGFLVVVSYIFYGWWDPRFLALILFSTLVDFVVARQMNAASERGRKWLLGLSIGSNLGLLMFFKYFNFLTDSLNQILGYTSLSVSIPFFEILLPVGISFYTFQTLSYTIDVYNRTCNAHDNPIDFAAYVSFFPQLVAGPIERASTFLPQILSPKAFDYASAVRGMQLLIWGFFKKLVLADNCATIVNQFYQAPSAHSGSTMAVVVVLFAFQIYCDFSGYTDIARGLAKLLGFELSINFNLPYFSRNIAEFWKRWHISLSTWFRDYVFIPLGGSRKDRTKTMVNIVIVFLVSGLWHGANWTFVLWGAYNAALFLPLYFFLGKKKRGTSWLATYADLPAILITFVLVCLGWVLFRSESVQQALEVYATLASWHLFSTPEVRPLELVMGLGVLVGIEWFGRKSHFPLHEVLQHKPRLLRWTVYSCLVLATILFAGSEQAFIYFQF